VTYVLDERWPENWRELPIPEYPTHLPREIYQLDDDGDPWNVIWCAEDIAIAYLPAGKWAISPMWTPPAPEVPPAPEE